MDIINKLTKAFHPGGTTPIVSPSLPEEVVSILGELQRELEKLREENKKLAEENRRLKERLSKNSSNSSKPPSTDGFSKNKTKKKPKPKNLRDKSERKPGGQPGRKGVTLEPSENPDHTQDHQVDFCPCGCHLDDSTLIRIEKRQVADIPPPVLEFTEHRAEVKVCPRCGVEVKAEFPPGVNGPVQYGPFIKACASYLMEYQLIPFARCAETLEDLFGAPVSEGSLGNFKRRFAEAVAAPVECIKRLITEVKVAHFDETGISVNGRRIWLHVACTPLATHYAIRVDRGRKAMDDIGVLPEFGGRAIHDHLSSYYGYNCLHGECGAHILRNLKFLEEERNQEWAKRMRLLLAGANELVKQAKASGRSTLEEEVERTLESAYGRIIDEGMTQHPPPVKEPGKRGKPKRTRERKMLDFLFEYENEILAFMRDFDVPFDNNLAERDIRMNKTKQKISGTFRGDDGHNHWCDIRSYISTARKNGINVIEAIAAALNGVPFVPNTA